MITIFRHIDRIVTSTTSKDAARRYSDAYVVVEDSVIREVGCEPVPSFWINNEFKEITARGYIMLPGFVNAHHHFFQSLTRGRAIGHSILEWLRELYPMWVRMDAAQYALAVDTTVKELLASGVTTSLDFAYLKPPLVPEFAEMECSHVASIGMRLVFVRGVTTELEGPLESQLRQDGFNADHLLESYDSALDSVYRLSSRYRSDPLIRIGVGPTTVPLHNLSLLRLLADAAEEVDGIKHIHFHPRVDEREWESRQRTSIVNLLRDSGWMDSSTLWAHGTNLTTEEISSAVESGTRVAHCAGTVTRLGYQPPPISLWKTLNLIVGLGVDGSASNDSGQFQSEIQRAYRLHRAHHSFIHDDTPPLSPDAFFYMATVGGAESLGYGDVGRIAPNYQADVVLYRSDQTGMAFFDDPINAIVLGDSLVPESIYIAGRNLTI